MERHSCLTTASLCQHQNQKCVLERLFSDLKYDLFSSPKSHHRHLHQSPHLCESLMPLNGVWEVFVPYLCQDLFKIGFVRSTYLQLQVASHRLSFSLISLMEYAASGSKVKSKRLYLHQPEQGTAIKGVFNLASTRIRMFPPISGSRMALLSFHSSCPGCWQPY